MRRVNNIILDISVDERLPIRKEPAITEWYRAGIEERRPLQLEAHQEVKEKAASFGFGLKKSGFGLNAPKDNQDQSEQTDNESQSSTFDHLKINGTASEINATLSSWAGWQHYLQLKYGAPSVYLGIGSIAMGNRTFGPILLIPVSLMTNQSEIHFELQFKEGERVYVPSVKRILDRKHVALPELPTISDDFEPSAWIEDVKSALVPHDELSFAEKSWLVRCTYQSNTKDRNSSNDSVPSITNIQEQNISYIPEQVDSVDPLPKAHRKYLDEVDPQKISWIISNDQVARIDLLRDLILSSLAHDQQILIIGRYNDQLSNLLDKCTQAQLNPLMLPVFCGYSSEALLQQIADIVDANWNVNNAHSNNGTSISKSARLEATKAVHDYQAALFKPHGALEASPAELIEQLLQFQEVPSLPVTINKVKEVTQSDIDRWTQIGIEYAKVSSGEIDPEDFEWSDTQLTHCSDDDLIDINESLVQLISIKNDLFSALLDAQEQTGLPIPSKADEIDHWIEQTEFFDSAPKLDEKQLRPDTLQHLNKGDRILQLLEKSQNYYQSVTSYFHKQILEEHLEGVVSRLRKQSLSSFRFLNYRYRKDISRLKQYRKDQDSDDDILFWEKLKDAKILKQIRSKLRKHEHEASRLFDESWNGFQSDVSELRRQYRWLKKFDKYTEGKDAANTLEIRNYVASLKRMTNDQKDAIRELQEQFTKQINECIDLAELKYNSDLAQLPSYNWHQIDKILKQRKQALKDLPDWLSYQQILEELDRPDLSDLLEKIEEHDSLHLGQWEQVLRKTVLQSLLNDAKNERQILNDVPQPVLSGSLDQLVSYRDKEVQKQISSLIQEHLNRRQSLVSDQEIQAGLNVLQHELKKQRRLQPKDRLLNQSHGTLKSFAPIWMLRYDQISTYKKWLDDFDLIIEFDPTQNELDTSANLVKDTTTVSVFHTDPPSNFDLDPYAIELEVEVSDKTDDRNPTALSEELTIEASNQDESNQPMKDEELIQDILADIDADAAIQPPSSSSNESEKSTNVACLVLPDKRTYIPRFQWPAIDEVVKKDIVTYSYNKLEKSTKEESKTYEGQLSKASIVWCSSDKHQELWEKICSNPKLSQELLSHRGPHVSPQILSSALQVPNSLNGIFTSQMYVNIPKVNTGSTAAPSFGFKKTKRKTQEAAFDQLPSVETIWSVTSDYITLISSDQNNIDKYCEKWTTNYYPKVDAENHLLASSVREHLGDEWLVTGHPNKPFELKITSNQYSSLSFYVWSDLLQQTDFQYMLDYYEVLNRSDVTLIHFPAVYYPSRLHEWLISLQQQLERAYQERHAAELAKQEEAQKKENITREVEPDKMEKAKEDLPSTDSKQTDDDQNTGPYDLPAGLKEYELPDEAPFDKTKQQQQAQLPKVNKLRPAEEYHLHEGQTLGTKIDFFDASDNEMQKLILDIVEIEAPIHWRNLLRCVASYWQIQRINQNVERVLLQNIQQLADNNRVFLKDGCIYSDSDFTFKLRDRSSTIEYHRSDELPLDECETALYELLNQRSPIQEQTLLRSGATLLGFDTFDRMLEHQFRKALYRMGEQDVIVKGPNGYELAPSYQIDKQT